MLQLGSSAGLCVGSAAWAEMGILVRALTLLRSCQVHQHCCNTLATPGWILVDSIMEVVCSSMSISAKHQHQRNALVNSSSTGKRVGVQCAGDMDAVHDRTTAHSWAPC